MRIISNNIMRKNQVNILLSESGNKGKLEGPCPSAGEEENGGRDSVGLVIAWTLD